MDEFLSELTQTFPQNADLRATRTKFNMFKKTTPSMALDEFRDCIKGCKEMIMNKDDSFIVGDDPDPLVKEYGLKSMWSSVTDDTKNAIWLHLQQLVIISDNITNYAEKVTSAAESMIPQMNPDTFAGIADVAKKIEKKLDGKEPSVQAILSDPDAMGDIMAMAQSMISGGMNFNQSLQ